MASRRKPGPQPIQCATSPTLQRHAVRPFCPQSQQFVDCPRQRQWDGDHKLCQPNVARVGKTYTLTATAAKGSLFVQLVQQRRRSAGRSGAYFCHAARRLVLQANFVTNPFLPVMGTFQGLFYVTNNLAPQSSGSFNATVTSNGTFTAKLQQGSQSHTFSGQFSFTGQASNSIARPGLSPLTLQLQLGLTDGSLTGQVSDEALDCGTGGRSRHVFKNKSSPAGRQIYPDHSGRRNFDPPRSLAATASALSRWTPRATPVSAEFWPMGHPSPRPALKSTRPRPVGVLCSPFIPAGARSLASAYLCHQRQPRRPTELGQARPVHGAILSCGFHQQHRGSRVGLPVHQQPASSSETTSGTELRWPAEISRKTSLAKSEWEHKGNQIP